MTNAVEIRDLCKVYDKFSLKEVSMEVPTGYITGFIGPNGSGKTTTIRCLLNMADPTSGTIKLFDVEQNRDDLSSNEAIGVVMDSTYYLEDWLLADVEKAVSLFYSNWDGVVFQEYLKRFHLDPTKKVKELSRGMKVKLMLAVALSHDARLLVLDEPTSGLDPSARDEICDILQDFVLDDRKSVLFSTHITSDLEKIADYIVFILDGRVVFSGLKEELMAKYCAVKGGSDDITQEQAKMIIGLRQHPTGFEGMIAVEKTGGLSKDLLLEPISLEDIIIYMNREAYDE